MSIKTGMPCVHLKSPSSCLPPDETLKARAPSQAKNFHAVLHIKLLFSRKYRSLFGLNRMCTQIYKSDKIKDFNKTHN